MTGQSIQQVSPNSGALSKEHYQTFEMAKANDTILGGDDLQQIRSYAAFTRAQAQAMHKTIASMSDVEDVMASKAEMTETAQTFAKVSVYADQRIGEILRELPKAKGNQYQQSAEVGTPTKAQAIKQANIDHHTAIDLQAMAANPEVVEAVIAKAEKDGRVVSRAQVLRAIKEKERAESELEAVNDDLKQAWQAQEDAEAEVIMLQRKLESIEHPKPEVVTREVEVVREVESEESKRRVHELEHLERIHSDDNQKLRRKVEELNKKLDQAKTLLGEKDREHNARWDISALTTATNNYLRQHGGKVWAFDQFDRVDEPTQKEFEKAITNLAAFSQNMVAMIQDRKQLGA